MAVEIVAPTPEALAYLAEHLREQDRFEVEAVGRSVHQAVRESVEHSKATYIACEDGVPIAVFGHAEYGSLLAPVGVPWLLGTDGVRRNRRVLQRFARQYIESLLAEYPRLMNAVHAENSVSIAWLRRLGFELHAPVRVPPHGALFHRFEMIRHV